MPLDNNDALEASMDAAYALVSRVITCAAAKGKPLTDGEATQVETYLAAHFVQVSDPAYSSRSTANKSGAFHDGGAKKYQTRYLARAILLDPSGCLRNFFLRNFASFTWIGKTDPEKLTYEQRNGTPGTWPPGL